VVTINSKAQFTPHEMLELHEMIRSEVLGARKIEASLAMVTDPDLKSFMQQSMQSKQDTLTRFQSFYKESAKQ